jgi:cyclic pyranopterin phosphate synthase
LFNELAFPVREYGVEEAFEKALAEKPKAGTRNKSGKFYGIGG